MSSRGVGFDETLGNGVKMTILAAGFDVTLSDEEDEIMKKGGGFGFPSGRPGSRPATPPAPPVATVNAAGHNGAATASQDCGSEARSPYGVSRRGF